MHAQGSSKSWSDVSQKIIKRQRAAIEKLKQDNGALKHELALEVCPRCSKLPPSFLQLSRVSVRSQDAAAIPSQSLQQELVRLREALEIYSRKACAAISPVSCQQSLWARH